MKTNELTRVPAFDRLVHLVWRLRQKDGCPWDRAQTHESLSKHMLEEAYEALDAIEKQSDTDLKEELGDVLEQVLLHAQIAADEGAFTIEDVCENLAEKLIRRHPHIFGDATPAQTPDDVMKIWDRVKQEERAAKNEAARKNNTSSQLSMFDSIPKALPALMQLQKMYHRMHTHAFDASYLDTLADELDPGDASDAVADDEARVDGAKARERTKLMHTLIACIRAAEDKDIDLETELLRLCQSVRTRAH